MWERRGLIFSTQHAQGPTVEVLPDKWRIYYSTRINGKSYPLFIDVEIESPFNIIYQHETPILQLGDIGTFDHAGINPTHIVTLEKRKHLYYVGWSLRRDIPYLNTVGLAVSDDNGNTWSKISTGPVLGISHRQPSFVASPFCEKKDEQLFLFYSSGIEWLSKGDSMEPLQNIKNATSTNGIDWVPQDVVINIQDDEGGLARPCIVRYKGVYFMWYCVRGKYDYRTNPCNSYRIKCAVSFNLIKWDKIKDFSLDISEESAWDNLMVAYPFVVKTETKLYMFYNGNSFGKTGIGFATLNLSFLDRFVKSIRTD